MINVKDLSIKYGSGKGVFDINFSIKKGEILGYLGPNGAGKTTTIRGLLGFIKPTSGSCRINNLDCFDNAAKIQKTLGYVPGETALPDSMKADEFLKFIGQMRNMKDFTFQKELMDMFEFKAEGYIKKFSKGMKQKLAIISAFMDNPDVIILDEPTSGLDPLMQNRFIQLVLQQKKQGKTILMSSHIFEEVEKTCDNVLIIKDGRVVSNNDIATLKSTQRKGFILTTNDTILAKSTLKKAGYEIEVLEDGSIKIYIKASNVDIFIKTIATFNIVDLSPIPQTLEDVFMHFYGKDAV